MDIRCSNCGRKQEVKTAHDALCAIYQGWRNHGDALYCPECMDTWVERNGDRPHGSARDAFYLITSEMLESGGDE